jgi:hypothetical protein
MTIQLSGPFWRRNNEAQADIANSIILQAGSLALNLYYGLPLDQNGKVSKGRRQGQLVDSNTERWGSPIDATEGWCVFSPALWLFDGTPLTQMDLNGQTGLAWIEANMPGPYTEYSTIEVPDGFVVLAASEATRNSKAKR